MAYSPHDHTIYIDISQQTLQLRQGQHAVFATQIASALNGPGEIQGSEKTPRGWHYIRARIGDRQPENAVFVGRRPTGEIFSESLRKASPERDWILTRILWLCGLEPGFNRLGNVDTMRRYIYIHGCPDSDVLGHPGSHGCIKMRNTDMIELFDRVTVGTRVFITE